MPEPERLLLRGPWIVPVDPALPEVIKGDLVIEHGQITSVGPEPIRGFDGVVYELQNHIAIPGLVDTHRHCWQTLFRYSGADWDLSQYGRAMWHTVGPRMTAEDTYFATRLALADALNSGVTQVFDWDHAANTPEHADATIEAHRHSLARVVFGYGQSSMAWADLVEPGLHSSPQPPSQDLRRIRDEFYASEDQLQTLALAARGPELSPDEVVRDEIDMARDLGLRSSVHVRRGHVEPIRKMQALGAEMDRVTWVHANGIFDEELDIIGDTGGAVSVSSDIEMRMGHGSPVIGRLWDRGITTSLSIDTCASSTGDLFTAMRTALAQARQDSHLSRESDKLMPTTHDALRWATIEGADANGLAHTTGSLTPGKAADITIISPFAPHMIPLNNPIGTAVIGTNPGDVEMVIVNGRVVKERGRLLLHDLKSVTREAVWRRDAVFERVDASPGGWDPPSMGLNPTNRGKT